MNNEEYDYLKGQYNYLKGNDVKYIDVDGTVYLCFVANISEIKGITLIDHQTGDAVYCFTDDNYNKGLIEEHDAYLWSRLFRRVIKEIKKGCIDRAGGWTSTFNAKTACPFK